MDTFVDRRRWLPKGLPTLTGWGRLMFMASWLALLAVSLWSSAMMLPSLYAVAIKPVAPAAALGFRLMPGLSTNTIGALVEPYASTVGIHYGDQLIAIDGRPVAPAGAALDHQLDGAIGGKVTVTTQSSRGAFSNHVLIRDPDRYRRALAAVGLNPVAARLAPAAVSFVLDTVLVLACAVLLMARRPRDPVAPWASMMMLWMVIGNGGGGQALWALFQNPDLAYAICNAVCFSLLVTVLAVFPEGKFEPRWSFAVMIAGVIGVIATNDMSSAVSNFVLLFAQLAAVAAIAVRYRAMPPGTGRQQIRWALLGFGASLVALGLLSIVQYAFVHAVEVGAGSWLAILETVLASATLVLLILSLTVSLLRYRLYDADATISRSIVYGTLTLSLLAIFAGSEKVIEIMGERYLGARLGTLAGGVGAAIAAVMIVPLHHRVTRWAERRFRSGLVQLREGLPVLVGDMRETATPAILADAMLARVERGVRARHGAVVLGGEVLDVRDVGEATVVEWLARGGTPFDSLYRLHADRADPLFPMRVPLHADGIGLVGWLLLGPRPDGTFYGREERQALREIAEPVARGLVIAIERTQREAERLRRDDARDRELGRLGSIVSRLQARLGLDASTEAAT